MDVHSENKLDKLRLTSKWLKKLELNVGREQDKECTSTVLDLLQYVSIASFYLLHQ